MAVMPVFAPLDVPMVDSASGVKVDVPNNPQSSAPVASASITFLPPISCPSLSKTPLSLPTAINVPVASNKLTNTSEKITAMDDTLDNAPAKSKH